MPHTLIDSHCHLDFSAFSDDLDAVLNNAEAAKIDQFIVPAVARNNWQSVRALSQKHQQIKAAYGLHPCFVKEHQLQDLTALDQWLEDHPVVAVGECGLDFRPTQTDKKLQQQLFEGQIDLAKKHQLPIIIHAVRAVTAVIESLRVFPGVTGVLHSYSGSKEQAQQLLDMGFYFGFGGPVTWDNARKVKAVVEYLPLDAIVVESDAPDQPPERYRGQRNEPAWITEAVQTIADLQGVSAICVADATRANTINLFGLEK